MQAAREQETQQWPQDWKWSVFIPIPKKANAKECSNYHTIALISHASKVMLKILQAREWQATAIFLPGKSHGQRSLMGYSPCGCTRARHDLSTKPPPERVTDGPGRVSERVFCGRRVTMTT